MKARVFYPNKENKIVFTKEQLEKLLSEVYEEGRADGYSQGYNANRPVSITYPYTPYWYTLTNSRETDIVPTITCNGTGTNSNYTTTSAVGTITIGNVDGALTIGDEK